MLAGPNVSFHERVFLVGSAHFFSGHAKKPKGPTVSYFFIRAERAKSGG